MFDAVAMDGPPPPRSQGARVSERFQRMRVPALPTILFADANEDYRSMARDALLEGRNATDLRTVADGTELLAYLQRAGATEGAVTPAPSLIILDAQLGFELIETIKAAKRIPVVVLGADDDPETVASGLRRRRQHVHRQAGHVPRARAADEGLHRLLARDRRTVDGRGTAPPRSAPRARGVGRRRASRSGAGPPEGLAARARDDAGTGPGGAARTAVTTSSSSTARSTRPAPTGCTWRRNWSRPRRTRR